MNVNQLLEMVEFNRSQRRHQAQIDQLYEDKERREAGRKKLYTLVPIALCQCEICVEMAEEVYSV